MEQEAIKIGPGDIPLEELGLPARTYFALYRSVHRSAGYILAHASKVELINIRSLGKKSYDAVIQTLREKGFDVGHLI